MAPRTVKRLSRMLGTPLDSNPICNSVGILRNTNSQDVLQCIKILEHAGHCQPDGGPSCVGRDACCRAQRVLLHHRHCVRSLKGGPCAVCHQLRALCLQHSTHCTAAPGECPLPHCHNEAPEQYERRRRLIKDYCTPIDCSSEKYRELGKKVKAARKASSEVEKRHRLMELLTEDPRGFIHYLRGEGRGHALRAMPYGRPAALTVSNSHSSYTDTLSKLSMWLRIVLL